MDITFIEARDLPDAWFQCLYQVMEKGREYVIDRGSYKGQKRREFEFAVVKINYPETRPIHLYDMYFEVASLRLWRGG